MAHARPLIVRRGHVLVIEGDPRVGSDLAEALAQHGYEVEVRAEAQAGFQQACARPPDCIVCNPELPDIDGAWVARKVRTEPGPLARVPIVFVAPVIDRTQALSVGVDAFVSQPADVLAQVDAIIAMARRLSPEDASPTSIGAALRGDLSMFPLASVLMMLEMERRSGAVIVVAEGGARASMSLAHGLFASAQVDGKDVPPLAALRTVLAWRTGRFAFTPKSDVAPPEAGTPVGALVLEAMRLEDEEKERAEELDPADLEEAPLSTL